MSRRVVSREVESRSPLDRSPTTPATARDHQAPWNLANALVALALLASSFGFAAIEDEPQPEPVPASTPTATPTSMSPTHPPEAPIELAVLTVAPEADGADYERSAFRHWVDADGDGCDARQEVLVAESRIETAPISERGCPVTAGEWISLYDGVVVTVPSKLDIDHMVPLKEAWESTASTWSAEQRQGYANDLDEPLALLAVTASSNRSKSDRDPGEWKPPDESVWCLYATAWVTVKVKWSLTADEQEVAALREMLARC